MAVSTVKLNGTILMTVNDTTATQPDVSSPKYFYGADGVKRQGTSQGGGGGGGGSIDDDVVFIDYDGTVLHSYSASDFQALTAMPSNPSHSGLTAQGWNWSLSGAKEYLSDYPGSKVVIGQMYNTSDGKTRIYIRLTDERKSPMLGLCPNGSVDVDWGDGSSHDTLTGTSLTTIQWTQNHNYATGGEYVIKLTVTGKASIVGTYSSEQSCRLLRYTSGSDNRNIFYSASIYKAEIGDNMVVGDYAFYYCYSLSSIMIPYGYNEGTSLFNTTSAFCYCNALYSISFPSGLTSISQYNLRYCHGLKIVCLPETLTSLGYGLFNGCHALSIITIPASVTGIGTSGGSVFYDCWSLDSITVPDNITKIPNSTFRNCYNLKKLIGLKSINTIEDYSFIYCYCLSGITIPSGVSNIPSSAFNNCRCAAEFHFTSTVPPTLAATTAFTNIPADCKIYVPYSADHSVLEAYQTANNWSTYASYMVEETP